MPTAGLPCQMYYALCAVPTCAATGKSYPGGFVRKLTKTTR